MDLSSFIGPGLTVLLTVGSVFYVAGRLAQKVDDLGGRMQERLTTIDKRLDNHADRLRDVEIKQAGHRDCVPAAGNGRATS